MSKQLTNPALLSRVEALLGDALVEVEKVFTAELASENEYLHDILKQASGLRGKRLRPILLLLTAEACGGIRREHIVLAAVVEMIHMATLVHDDVLDDATTRRHLATVNARWNNETSVLFGDYLFTHSFHLAASLPSTQACRLIGRATNIVCEGELQQIHERGNFDLDEATYLKIINGKTAELCAVSCRLGAMFADAEEQTIDSLEEYGRSLGIAFQIADDIMDLTGTENTAGKSLGSDLQKQKLTLPLIHLLQQAEDGDRPQLLEFLSTPDAEAVSQLHERLERSDAVTYARQRAEEFAHTAVMQLTSLPGSSAKDLLEETAEFAVQRHY